MNDMLLGILIAAPIALLFLWIKLKKAPYHACGCGCRCEKPGQDSGPKKGGSDNCCGDTRNE